MGEFPWQKRDDGRWAQRMPWQRHEPGTSAEPSDPATPASDATNALPPRTGEAHEDAPRKGPMGDVDPAPTREPATEGEPDAAVLPPYARTPVHAAKSEPHPPASPAATPSGPPPARRARRVSPLVGVVAVGSILTGVVILGALLGSDDSGASPDPGAGGAEAEEAVAATVEGYFAAIAGADADRALAHTDLDPDAGHARFDFSLMTDETLARSQEQWPIRDVEIGRIMFDAEYDWRAVVEVTYQLGDERVDAEYEVHEAYDGEYDWLVEFDIRPVLASGSQFAGVDLRLDDQTLPVDAYVLLFPGRYEVAMDSAPHLGFLPSPGLEPGAEGPAFLTAPVHHEFVLSTTVSDRGARLFEEAVRASLDECLASTALTSDCTDPAYGSFASGDLIDGSVTRTIAEDRQPDFTPRTDAHDVLALRGRGSTSIDVSGTCADGGSCTGWELTGTPTVHFDGDATRVTWD